MKAYNDNHIYCTAINCTNTYCESNQNLIGQEAFENARLPLAMADFWKMCEYGDRWGEKRWIMGREKEEDK